MSAIPKPKSQRTLHPDLRAGDRMTREEFHRVYEQTPEGFRAELIGGVVHVPSPLRDEHGTVHLALGTVLFTYMGSTPGTWSSDNATVLLGDEGEPQPDLYLRILPEYGGRAETTADGYVNGPPELVAEIAHSSRAIDLHAKLKDYRRYGVLEYLVACLDEEQVRWFDFRGGQEPALDSEGVLRSRLFPGLWIDTQALFALDYHRLMAAVNAGLAAPEHAEFVKHLAAKRS